MPGSKPPPLGVPPHGAGEEPGPTLIKRVHSRGAGLPRELRGVPGECPSSVPVLRGSRRLFPRVSPFFYDIQKDFPSISRKSSIFSI